MATVTTGAPTRQPATRSRRTAVLFVAGGLVLAAGGQTHPQGSGDTVDAHLLSMFSGPTWGLSHVLLLIGSLVCVLALESARRAGGFGSLRPRWLLPGATAAWAFGALETVPHLLAAGESDALSHHDATPLLDVHVVLQLIATPMVGFATALTAVALARTARSRVAWVLAVPAVVGGLAYGVAGPLVVATGDPAFTVLFPFLAGLAVWLVGTGLRLLRR